MAAGAALVVVDSMRAFPWSESLQLAGAGACWCLATTAENEAAVVAAGGLDVNRACLANHPSNAMLLQQVCGAIRNLTVADAHKELFCASQPDGGLQACKDLVAALRTHVSSTALAQQASGSIAALAMWGSNKGVLGGAGAIEAVVGGLRAHPGADEASAQVHEECCAALRNLAANHAPNKEAIAAAGGIEALVASMGTHLASPLNQLHAAGALWNVPANNAPNKARVVACGGIEALLRALQTHPEDVEVQLECMGSLRNLSTLAENKPLILAKRALPTVLAAMTRMMDVSLLQEQACALLFNLANSPSDAASSTAAPGATTAHVGESVSQLLELDAPAIVASVLAAHMGSPNVVEESTASLWIMHRGAAASVVWPSALRARILDLAELALVTHPNAPGVVNFASGMKAAWRPVATAATLPLEGTTLTPTNSSNSSTNSIQ